MDVLGVRPLVVDLLAGMVGLVGSGLYGDVETS